MTIDVKTLAYVNFYAAIGTLEKYVEYDESAKAIAAQQDIVVRFNVKGGPDGVVVFKDGKVKVLPYDGERKVDINLYCSSCDQFNKVVAGTAMPIPTKGLFKTLAFMGKPESPFNVLTGKMAEIMRKARYAMKRILDGEISLGIKDECYATLVKSGGNDDKEARLTCIRRKADNGRAFMTFGDLETAKGLIDGVLDSMACISSGKLDTRGHMLMLDNLNKILNIVPKYLA